MALLAMHTLPLELLGAMLFEQMCTVHGRACACPQECRAKRQQMAGGRAQGVTPLSLAANPSGGVVAVFQGRDPQAQEGWSPVSPYLVGVRQAGQEGNEPGLDRPHRLVADHSISYPSLALDDRNRLFVAYGATPDDQPRQVFLLRGRQEDSR